VTSSLPPATGSWTTTKCRGSLKSDVTPGLVQRNDAQSEILAGRCARSQSTLTYGLLVEVQPLTLRQSPARNPVRGIGEQPEDGGVVQLRSFCLGEVTIWPPYPLTACSCRNGIRHERIPRSELVVHD
jgi:hypothetical protein